MKRYLVKLNRPVIVADSPCELSIKHSIYGFLFPYIEADEGERAILEDEIYDFVGYLAAMHDWSASSGDVEFAVTETKDWRDQEGHLHPICSHWALEIGHRHKNKLGLDFTLYTIDTDGIDGVCLDCGKENSFITCESLMKNLVRLAEKQEEEERDERHTVILFNRPIWLPNHFLWDDAKGFSNVYGVVADRELDEELLKMGELYLGYLAICEECSLTGQTPSGFTTKDYFYWNKDGEEYPVIAEEIKAECLLCKNKHNLKPHAVAVWIPKKDMEKGVEGDLVISKWLYDSLIEKTGIVNGENWMSKIN